MDKYLTDKLGLDKKAQLSDALTINKDNEIVAKTPYESKQDTFTLDLLRFLIEGRKDISIAGAARIDDNKAIAFVHDKFSNHALRITLERLTDFDASLKK